MKERTIRAIRWSLLRLLALGALVETMWTIYLGVVLPRHYIANHWDIAWVGMDAAQVVMLGASAWAAWRRSAMLVIFSTAASVLLLVDAWFDVTTARGGEVIQGIMLAALIEVPSALVLFWIAHRGVHNPAALTRGTRRPRDQGGTA